MFVDFSPAALDIGDSPDGLSNGRVYYNRVSDSIALSVFEPAGTMIVVEGPNGGQFVRRTLDEIATRGWPGEFGTDGTDQGNGLGATFAEGLNDYIAAEQPFWADEPELFALQLTARIGPNESVSIEYDDVEPPTITITTSGFLDDSVEGSQRIITTRRGSDGLLRFVSGTYGFRCQPGRGHQDYSVEPCN